MIRDLGRLTQDELDLCVIGGGIHGAFVAWDATLRGLSVALVEQKDFASATSSNSMKIAHGGFRYIRAFDFARTRQSVVERSNLMRIAPHLVHAMPVVVPLGGNAIQSRAMAWAALAISEAVGFDKNRRMGVGKHIPRGRFLSSRQLAAYLSGWDGRAKGGVLFYDGRISNTERLLLSVLRSASDAGAVVANYVKAIGFTQQDRKITEVRCVDELSGERFNIRASVVVNAAGPWVDVVRDLVGIDGERSRLPLAKAMNVVTRRLFGDVAVGLPTRDEASGEKRYFFFAPWRGRTIAGTQYDAYSGDPSTLSATAGDVDRLLGQINKANPSAHLTSSDVEFVHCGLVPMDEASSQKGRATRYDITDHAADGIENLISVVGVKYTTARHVAERVVDRVVAKNGAHAPRATSAEIPLHGGEIDDLESFIRAEQHRREESLSADAVRALIENYGAAYAAVLGHSDSPSGARLSSADIASAETRHAVREEMAQHLGDVVFRRTELGTAGRPETDTLRSCARAMANELGWDEARTNEEIRSVEERYMPLSKPESQVRSMEART